MKKTILFILSAILFMSCTNLDDVNSRLNDHENRIKILEGMVSNTNNAIENLKKLIDAESQKITIISYQALEDGSGYLLTMSDGSTITLKNGTDGKSPLIGVKQLDGTLYWTIDGEFMLDANGNKIKAEGQDGVPGVTPQLRVNVDGFWEISLDGGHRWQAIVGIDGKPVKAVGSDATVDLTITETDEAIIITFAGKTYTIPKQSQETSILYRIAMPTFDSFKESSILSVLDTNNKEIAQICLEYIKSDKVAKKMITLYSIKDNKLDNKKATSLDDGGVVNWDIENNSCSYIKGTENNKTEIYINPKDGSVSYSSGTKGTVRDALIEPFLLKDIRGEEIYSYKLVKVGTQYWMAENLRTMLYRDGTPITNHLSKKEWLKDTKGAVTAYDDDYNNIETMGGLYNWYAVTNNKGLAPEGYRVSTDEDWAMMAKYLDPQNYGLDEYGARESETIAPLLKSKEGWKEGGNGNDLSGLNILPFGSTSESKYMDYSGKERQAYIWTSTAYDNKTAMFRRLYYDETFLNRWYENKTFGYSVRCLLNN